MFPGRGEIKGGGASAGEVGGGIHVPLTPNQLFEDIRALSHFILQTEASSMLNKCSLTLGIVREHYTKEKSHLSIEVGGEDRIFK